MIILAPRPRRSKVNANSLSILVNSLVRSKRFPIDTACPPPGAAAAVVAQPVVSEQARSLYTVLPAGSGPAWDHGIITRAEAVARLQLSGLSEGLFLVRRKKSGPSVVSFVSKGTVCVAL